MPTPSAAVAAEVEARLFPQPPPLPQTPAKLPDLVTAVYHRSEGQLPLLRALVRSNIGPQIRARRASRLEAIRNVLEQVGAGQAETRRAIAVVSLLASADAGVVLADQYGLTLPEAGHASAEATRAIIDRLSAPADPAPGTHHRGRPQPQHGQPASPPGRPSVTPRRVPGHPTSARASRSRAGRTPARRSPQQMKRSLPSSSSAQDSETAKAETMGTVAKWLTISETSATIDVLPI